MPSKPAYSVEFYKRPQDGKIEIDRCPRHHFLEDALRDVDREFTKSEPRYSLAIIRTGNALVATYYAPAQHWEWFS